MKLRTSVQKCLCSLLFSVPLLLNCMEAQDYHLKIIRTRITNQAGQQFACLVPYTISDCENQIVILQTALHHYRAESLGEWTWVLVHSEDWKPILERVHMDPNSPAFTILERRQTFFEEVLLVPKPARQMELLSKLQTGFDQFLDLAVAHELGHAFCNDPDERRAYQFGLMLRQKQKASCNGPSPNRETKIPAGDKGARRGDHSASPRIALRITDFDHVEPAVIRNAKDVISEIFRKAHIETVWVDCVSQGRCSGDAEGPEVAIRIIPQALGSTMASDKSLGFAIPCAERDACYCYIFYWRIKDLAKSQHIAVDRLLGHIMAHEVGHELLGPNAHQAYGIMQHNLPLRETERILYFTSSQAKQLRANLLVRDAALGNAVLSNERAESVAHAEVDGESR
jgi:hypothetical protein